MEKLIKVIITHIGLDSHDRGSRVVAVGLKDAGMEVIYTGPWQTIEQVAQTALQEDVDVIGISSLGYDHVLIPKFMKYLAEQAITDVVVIAGGIIPEDDVQMLKEAGVAGVFGPGSRIPDMVSFIKKEVARQRKKKAKDGTE